MLKNIDKTDVILMIAAVIVVLMLLAFLFDLGPADFMPQDGG